MHNLMRSRAAGGCSGKCNYRIKEQQMDLFADRTSTH